MKIHVHVILCRFSDHSNVAACTKAAALLCPTERTWCMKCVPSYNYVGMPVLYNSYICTPQLPCHVCCSQMNACVACLMHQTLPHPWNMHIPFLIINSLVRSLLSVLYYILPSSPCHCSSPASQFPTLLHRLKKHVVSLHRRKWWKLIGFSSKGGAAARW